MEPFLGQLLLVPYNFAPNGWALCNGQILSIAQNTALFSLLGTTFGGDGITNFALPDLRGRVPVSSGQAPGLSFYNLGEQLGVEAVTLLTTQMPAHNHLVNAVGSPGGSNRAGGDLLANSTGGNTYNPPPSDGTTLNAGAISNSGGSQPHENRQPTLVLNWIIALIGVYPSRN